MNLLIFAFIFFDLRFSRGEFYFGRSTLEYVTVISRHGSRAAIWTYPTDPYPPNNTKYWPDGPGHLTLLGKWQAYTIGVNLRARYNGYLTAESRPSEALITSNLMTRDLESGQLVGAGMFPPTERQMWNPGLQWTPVAVWPDHFDVVDVTDYHLCPRFDYLQSKAYEKAYDEIYLPNKDFYDLVGNFTGLNFTDIRGMKAVFDSLAIYEVHNLDLPHWAKLKHIRERIDDLAKRQYIVKIVGHPDMIRLTAGPVLKNIVHQLENKSKPKIQILLSHDNTIFSVAHALGLTNFPIPDMGSHLIFEHHRVPGLGDVIQVFYARNSSTKIYELIDLPVCRHPCGLTNFIEATKKITPENWEAECWSHSSSSSALLSAAPWTVATLCVLGIVTRLIH